MITALTCTGDRPKPFGFCIEYMARQTRRPDQWVIVDDGNVPLAHDSQRLAQHCGIADVQIVRRFPKPGDPAHTLSVNLLAALDRVSSASVAFIEDDDWYSCEHMEILEEELRAHAMFGFQGIVYYHAVRRCYRTMGEGTPHSSMCQTGITSAVFPVLKRICAASETPFIDLRLWREFTGQKKLFRNLNTVVGIKGLPGRLGLTAGWRSVTGYTPDPDLKYLESLIGEDVANYRT